jgi:hypothetical protein
MLMKALPSRATRYGWIEKGQANPKMTTNATAAKSHRFRAQGPRTRHQMIARTVAPLINLQAATATGEKHTVPYFIKMKLLPQTAQMKTNQKYAKQVSLFLVVARPPGKDI